MERMHIYPALRESIDNGVPVASTTVIAGPDGVGNKMLVFADGKTQGTLGGQRLDAGVSEIAMRLLREERAQTESFEIDGQRYDVFVDVFPALHQLVIVGATHTAAPLSQFAKALGYAVIITDARGAFAQPERFPHADSVIKGWPQDVLPRIRLDASTYVVLLSHDPKFDEPTLEVVLPSAVPYIGAIGSRRTQIQRFERLRQRGFTEEQLARVYGPVGLDIGGTSVEETALAILAEVTAVRHGRDGGSLRHLLAELGTSVHP